jgi:hypothetical protein
VPLQRLVHAEIGRARIVVGLVVLLCRCARRSPCPRGRVDGGLLFGFGLELEDFEQSVRAACVALL